MEDLKSKIIGGIIVVVLGGTSFAVSQTSIVDNFAKETGMSQEQAQKYVEQTQNDLESFKKVGSDLVSSGKSLQNDAASIDCANYVYDWESETLSCSRGKIQIEEVGLREVSLGNCYESLETDLGELVTSKINECIAHIDTLNTAYDHEIIGAIFEANYPEEAKKSNLYNKSVLKAALESNR